MRVAVCLKWVQAVGDAEGGVSAADDAALEVALAFADANRDVIVRSVSCGDFRAEAVVRRALAAGAHEAVRIDGHPGASSATVGEALASAVADCDVVLCGDHSLDRGSGAVPAYLAGMLGRPQALGLIEIDFADPRAWRATRRLDGGRRELLTVRPPVVLSIEAPVARLRRASLPATRAAATAVIDVRPGPPDAAPEAGADVTPFSPRARVIAPPAGDTALARIRVLTDVGDTAPSGEPIVAEPAEASELIITALRQWGYLPAEA